MNKNKELKEAQINIRITPKVKAQLKLKAKASGMNLTKYLVTAGLNKKPIKPLPEIDKHLYLELCRQGNNLDWLARLHNTEAASGVVYELHADDRAMLNKTYSLLEQVLKQFLDRAAN